MNAFDTSWSVCEPVELNTFITVLPVKSEWIILSFYTRSVLSLFPLKAGEFHGSCCFATADVSSNSAKTVSNLYNVCLVGNRSIDINVMLASDFG